MRTRSSVFAMIAVVAFGACTVAPGAADPTQTAPTTVAPSKPIGEAPSEKPEPSVAEEPITYPADNMWDFLSTTPGQVNGTMGLGEAVRLAEVVVVGKYASVERGPGYGPPGGTIGWYAVARIAVDAVVKGHPNLDSDGLIRVPFLLVLGGDEYPEKEFADLQRSIPEQPAFMLLYSWAAYWDQAGGDVPGWLDGLNTYDQYKTIGADGVFRVEGDRLEPMTFATGWPVQCRGISVETMTHRVRSQADAIGGPAGSPGSCQ